MDVFAGMPQRRLEEREGDYIDATGLVVCGKCGEHRTTHIVVEQCGVDAVIVCACACDRKEFEESNERSNATAWRRKVLSVFPSAAYADMTFARDDVKNAEATSTCQAFAEYFDGTCRGLQIVGGNGVGKTFLAAAVVNELMDAVRCRFYTVDSLRNICRSCWDGAERMQEEIRASGLVVIDDIGASRDTPEVADIKRMAVFAAYDSGTKLIVTADKDLEHCGLDAASLDRLRSMCFPVRIDGESRRTSKKTS